MLIYGRNQTPPQAYYIFGSFALLITAIHYKLIYFIALELILAAGHTSILLGIGPYVGLALPLLMCLQLLVFYLMIGKENSIFLLIGIVGIALLSMGLAYNNQIIFFSGSSGVAIYAYYNAYKGQYISYLWGVLNTILASFALYQLILRY
ncbi:membrane protein [Legionella norrlandica]|uniref:Membrane protein n=1 Tax=Legionella norrlandica TaxID=1498499 RepID=A0A0A2T8X2_9GAMM|nr:membrane protein [Legionella norrlandica]